MYTVLFCIQIVLQIKAETCVCVCLRFRAHNRLVTLDAFFNEVKLIAQRLVPISHTDLSHICLAYIIAFWTFLQVIITQEVNLLLWDDKSNGWYVFLQTEKRNTVNVSHVGTHSCIYTLYYISIKQEWSFIF